MMEIQKRGFRIYLGEFMMKSKTIISALVFFLALALFIVPAMAIPDDADYGVYRNGQWIFPPGTGEYRFNFGIGTDTPVVYDDSAAVFRNGQWIVRAADGSVAERFNFGLPTDLPVVYDDSAAVFRNGQWIVRAAGGTERFNFGTTGDKPVAFGDYGAVFRNGQWIVRAADGSVAERFTFGVPTDLPVVWHDGKAAVYRNGHYIVRADDGSVAERLSYGTIGDKPVTVVSAEPPEAYSVTFTVVDESEDSIEGALVDLDGVEEFTDEDGVAVFEGVAPGEYVYMVSADSYVSVDGTVTVVDENKMVNITLTAEPSAPLEVVSVEAIHATKIAVTGTGFTEDNIAELEEMELSNNETPATTYAVSDAVYVSATEATMTTEVIANDVTVAWLFGENSGTFAGDTTAPTVVSVENVNGNQLVVTFNKPIVPGTLSTTGALFRENYMLRNLDTNKQIVLNEATPGGAAATPLIVVSPDQTVVTITLTAAQTNSMGLDGLNTLDDVQYRIFFNPSSQGTVAKRIADVAGNKLATNAYKQFTGVIEADETAPELYTATYNKGTGKLVMTFNKEMIAAIDYQKVSFNNYALTAALTGVAASGDNGIEGTVVEADRLAILDLEDPLMVNLAAGAVKDTSDNENEAVSKEATITVPPYIINGSYNGLTHRLYVNFNAEVENVGTDAATLTKLSLYSEETGKITLNADDYIISKGEQYIIELNTVSQEAFEKSGGTVIEEYTDAVILIEADAVKNTADGTQNLKNYVGTTYTTGAPLTVHADTEKPVLVSATYLESTSRLVLTFDKPVEYQVADMTQANLKIKSDGTAGDEIDITLADLTDADITNTASLTTLTIKCGADDLNIAAGLKAAFRQGDTIYFYMSANAIQDTSGNWNALLGYGELELVYTDDVAPILDGAVDVVDSRTIKVTFDEKVTTATAQATANYAIVRTSTGDPVTVTSATLSVVDQKTVTLVTGPHLAGQDYTLTINGVKDNSGNPTVNLVANYLGSGTVVTPAEMVEAVIVDVNGNNQLDASDKIKVTYDKPLAFATGYNTGSNMNNMFVLNNSGKFATEDLLHTAFTIDGIDLYIQLGTGVDLPGLANGTQTIATVANADNIYLKDETGTKVKASDSVSLDTPVGAPELETVVITDVDASGHFNAGDTIVGTFSSPMSVVDDQTFKIADIGLTGGKTLGTGATLAFTEGTDTFTVTLGTTPTLLPSDIGTVNLTVAADQLENSWSMVLAAQDKEITGASTAAPIVTAVEWNDGEEFYFVTFDRPVYTTLTTEDSLRKDGTAITVTATAKVAPTKIRFTSTETSSPGVTRMDIIQDVVAGKLTSAYNVNATQLTGNGVVVTYSSDTDAPTIESAEFISQSEIVVTFDKPVKPQAAATTNFTSAGVRWTAGLSTTHETYPVSTEEYSEQIKVTLTADVSASVQTNGLTNDLRVGAGVVKDMAGNPNAALTTGGITIAGDTTPPTDVPDKTKLTFSFITGNVTATADVTSSEAGRIDVWIGTTTPTTATTQKGYYTLNETFMLPDATEFNVDTDGLAAGMGVWYRFVDRANNPTAWVQDGVIPAAPTLPVATTLIPADVAAAAPAGFVNNASKLAVNLTPGIEIDNGESLTILVTKTNTVGMTATATADAVTPVFGGTTATTTYTVVTAGNGNTTTGSLNFTNGAVVEGDDVEVRLFKTNADGIRSAYSNVIEITYDITVPEVADAITQNDDAEQIQVNITEAYDIFNTTTSVKLNTGLDSKASWNITGNGTANFTANGTIVVPTVLSAGGIVNINLQNATTVADNETVVITFSPIRDNAGNALVNDVTAANLKLIIFSNQTVWNATWSALP